MVLAALKHFVRNPGDAARAAANPAPLFWRAYDRVRDRFGSAFEAPPAPERLVVDDDWPARLHARLNAKACAEDDAFERVWAQVNEDLHARGFAVGPESYFGWNDGDPAFLKALWCLVRHTRPLHVVETGVAHGLTSRFILEAMQANDQGRLYSIDLPPIDPEVAAQVGVAVQGPSAQRWRLLKGTSREHLPALLRELGHIDIFVHDSLHTDRNVRFEVGQAVQALSPGGFVVIDDIDTNSAYPKLRASLKPDLALVCQSNPVRNDERRFNGKGLFAVLSVRGERR